MVDDALNLDDMGWEWGSPIIGEGNPYLDDVMRFVERYQLTIGGNRISLDPLVRRIDPNFYIAMQEVFGPDSLRHRYSFAIPTDQVLGWMGTIGPIVEVGAGKGYWAAMMSARGGDILAYDAIDPRDNRMTDRGDPWHPISIADCEVAADHPDRTLFLCWPPLGTDMAARTVSAYLASGGGHLVYIGESAGGCTASDSFFDIVETRMTDITPIGVDVLSWWGVHDHVYLYERR